MPEARDRLSRQEDDLIAAYSLRRISRAGDRNTGISGPIASILEDESEEGPVAVTPFRWRGRGMVGMQGPIEVISGRGDGRGILGTPGSVGVTPGRGGAIRHSRTGWISPVTGLENPRASGRGRGRGTALPAWYPRRPFHDITAVMRAIERRRERRRAGEGLGTESPTPQDTIFHYPSTSTPGAQLGHSTSMTSPRPTSLNWHCPPSIGKVPKILLDITHQNGDSACLTPQKKLLNNIDTVEKVVMEELRKLKRTPSAKRAEREKRVRTLMSMR